MRRGSISRTLDGGRDLFSLSALAFICLLAFAPQLNATIVDVNSPTTSWTAIRYSNNNPDPSNDQQTGSSEGDIVGNIFHASVYTTFGDGGTPSLTDGTLAFRIRLGADVSPAGFKTALFVGIDANNDGKIDLFVGVNNSGAGDTIGLWNPGTGANISPNTTSIVSTPLVSYTQTASNYSWVPVTTTIDPSVGTSLDLDGGGQNDYFLTFDVPFSDVVAQLSAIGITGFDQNSTLTYVIATATQANSLNQDLNGVDKNYDGSATWSTLGVLSEQMSASGISAVPEINPAAWIALLAAGLIGDRLVRGRRLRARSVSPVAR
jgi:hypothetical protein